MNIGIIKIIKYLSKWDSSKAYYKNGLGGINEELGGRIAYQMLRSLLKLQIMKFCMKIYYVGPFLEKLNLIYCIQLIDVYNPGYIRELNLEWCPKVRRDVGALGKKVYKLLIGGSPGNCASYEGIEALSIVN